MTHLSPSVPPFQSSYKVPYEWKVSLFEPHLRQRFAIVHVICFFLQTEGFEMGAILGRGLGNFIIFNIKTRTYRVIVTRLAHSIVLNIL